MIYGTGVCVEYFVYVVVDMLTIILITIALGLFGFTNVSNEEMIFLVLCLICDVLMLKDFGSKK